ncbi:polyribonucleotide nucleotidyltransferase [Candidatus Rhabdochlamydia sp. T3358]|uniref:polyribonucleotide nucleotidyltransferase n=1 Tax=Candidatus Rhabdochlamydia sp. T3358 TaxID=2099795 RepID=UPI0010B6BA0A|nr:polyribonucleotide nucleotidyltransferase [Candidatus Rhabdochlamydia sp. T3358]VHO04385.1 Polyribonucleotide nucleotidyltransferase [Candidatus Rhabdochlamydia sp. T3358]
MQFDHQKITVSIEGKTITFETGIVARQANGAVLLTCGETVLLSTACQGARPSAETDFLPLRIDYQEKFSSSGKTLGGFIKREGRPTERETLMSRLIDRPLRPLFEKGYFNEVQVLSYVLSYDGVNAPEPLAICAASAALVISDIPLIKPIGAVRVGMIDGKFVVNPTVEEQKSSKLDLMLAGTEDAILMIEGYADFLTEEQVLVAIEKGHAAIKIICQTLIKWQTQIGKPKNLGELKLLSTDLIDDMREKASIHLNTALRIKEKSDRESTVKALFTEMLTQYTSDKDLVYTEVEIKSAFKKIQAELLRKMILDENIRADGRRTDQVRAIDIKPSFLPRTHGSALFTRGETQSLSVCTLGGENMAQRSENLDGELSNRFYLQYFFPPFSVGEVGRLGAPGRREIGHGKLAERSLARTIPSIDVFPYVIRLESNITESNGSSSMASVCGCCLALMDAGVPIKRPIAGIAMGLILEEARFAILSDILGVEDALGDMDFKIAGDMEGITAFQLDIKVEGITIEVMQAALAQAKQGRLHILHKMLEACPKSKENLSSYAPRIETVMIKPSKIGTLIGPAGKQIRAIIEETGAQIDIDDSGRVSIASTNSESMNRAKEMIHNLTTDVEIGKTYKGKVVSIVNFGAFVEIYGKECLCHISELSCNRVQHVEDVVKLGDTIEVKVLDINDRGQVKLSHKATLPTPQKDAARGG